jgi:hypothetical protein
MKYQVVLSLKTTRRGVGVYETLDEAKAYLSGIWARFEALSYLVGFPIFSDAKGRSLSVQGLTDSGMVCSLGQREKESFVS